MKTTLSEVLERVFKFEELSYGVFVNEDGYAIEFAGQTVELTGEDGTKTVDSPKSKRELFEMIAFFYPSDADELEEDYAGEEMIERCDYNELYPFGGMFAAPKALPPTNPVDPEDLPY